MVGNHHREREHHTAAASAAAPSTREGIARHKCAQESVQKVKVSLEQKVKVQTRGTCGPQVGVVAESEVVLDFLVGLAESRFNKIASLSL